MSYFGAMIFPSAFALAEYHCKLGACAMACNSHGDRHEEGRAQDRTEASCHLAVKRYLLDGFEVHFGDFARSALEAPQGYTDLGSLGFELIVTL